MFQLYLSVFRAVSQSLNANHLELILWTFYSINCHISTVLSLCLESLVQHWLLRDTLKDNCFLFRVNWQISFPPHHLSPCKASFGCGFYIITNIEINLKYGRLLYLMKISGKSLFSMINSCHIISVFFPFCVSHTVGWALPRT